VEHRLRIFGKRVEVTGEWKILHNNELYDLSSLGNIIHMIKSIRIGWVGHVARGRQEMCIQVLVGNLSE
jgi:hypothetical protein